MVRRRALLIHSFSDKGFTSRLSSIKNNPDLADIEFSHICVVGEEHENRRAATIGRLIHDLTRPGSDRTELSEMLEKEMRELLSEEIAPLLESRIREFKPDIVIVHGGTIFSGYTGPFLQMIIDKMEVFPDLDFALEGKQDWLVEKSGQNNSIFERKLATNQIKWVRRNFIEDDDINQIISAVFH